MHRSHSHFDSLSALQGYLYASTAVWVWGKIREFGYQQPHWRCLYALAAVWVWGRLGRSADTRWRCDLRCSLCQTQIQQRFVGTVGIREAGLGWVSIRGVVLGLGLGLDTGRSKAAKMTGD
uniref:Uncharacterized protein n=1 Tax=Opuntia streptacantha TaxID=393608 RepID=A0A7C8YTL3_OPUST